MGKGVVLVDCVECNTFLSKLQWLTAVSLQYKYEELTFYRFLFSFWSHLAVCWGSSQSIIAVQSTTIVLLQSSKSSEKVTTSLLRQEIRSSEGWIQVPALPQTYMFFYLCLRKSGTAVLFSQGCADIF